MKKIGYILYLLLIFLAFKGNIYSWSGGIITPETGESGGGDTTKPPEVDLGIIGTDAYGNSYSCKYQYKINISNSVTINTYNKDGKVTNQNSLTPTEDTLAGTAIGMEIYEIKTITWDVPKIIVIQSGVIYTCKSEKQICNCRDTGYVPLVASIKRFRPTVGDCDCYYRYLYNQKYCPSGYKIDSTNKDTPIEIKDESNKYYKDCKDRAESETKEKAKKAMTSSYIVKLQDSNDIKSGKTINVYPNSCSSNGDKFSRCTYRYSIAKTCINVKTAAVNYITNPKSTCSSDEIEVNGSSNYWQYFTPLNTKSNDNFFISISASGKDAKQSAAACKYVINNYSNYKELIITSDNKQFTGSKSKDLSLANSGCYLSSIVNIPVKQKFYGEENNELKGYSFYYRSIDINNPFPNGIGDDSYWKEWNDSTNKNPDLSKSFAKVTYYTGTINTTNIRNYNKAYKYTSWIDMNTSGLSSFITDSMRINVNKKDIYKLGCGPLNKDWSECKK